MKNFINESWVAILVLIGLVIFGYASMYLIVKFGYLLGVF